MNYNFNEMLGFSLNKNSYFYEKNIKTDKSYKFEIPEYDNNIWYKVESPDWTNLLPKNHIMPNQGWKIHITSTIEDSSFLLYDVSEFLLEHKVPFKFVPSERKLQEKNSKSANRAYSAKFITIYTTDINQFYWLLTKLEDITEEYDEGPYILNDYQWKNSNVFYRYGAFKEMKKVIDGYEKYVIYDDAGNYYEDLRVPYYNVPKFVNKPDFIIENEKVNPEIFEKFNELEILESLHYSNAGGVYKVKKNNEIFILKEGRKNAGLDGNNKDGFSRIKNEYRALKRLERVVGVVKVYEYFEIWKHNYILEEFIEGETLQSYLSKNYPFINDYNRNIEFHNKAKKIIQNLHEIMSSIHNVGLAIGDLNTNNIIVKHNLDITIIDLEVSNDKKRDYKPRLGTPGMVNLNAKNFEEADIYSFYRICRYIYLPISSVQELSPSIRIRHNKYIENKFGRDALNYLINFEDNVYPKVSFWPEAFNLKKSLEIPLENITITNFTKFLLSGINSLYKYSNTNDIGLIPGNIHNDLDKLSKYNFAYGAFGLIASFLRIEEAKINNDTKDWIDNIVPIINSYKINNVNEVGLFNGLSGIINILYELRYEKEVKNQLHKIIEFIENEDLTEHKNFSLYSGLAGIGLTLASYYKTFDDIEINATLEKIVDVIQSEFEEIRQNNKIISSGLLSGWLGTALFLWKWGILTNNKFIKLLSIDILTYINENYISKIQDEITLSNGGKNSPYLFDGTLGFKLLVLEIYKDDKQYLSNDLMKYVDICKNDFSYSTTLDGGLMHGYTGFIVYGNALNSLFNRNAILEESLYSINNYVLADSDRNILLPGKFGFKCSMDLMEGISGLLLTLNDIGNEKWNSWIPLPASKMKIFEI
ncbi:class III lanthionine synthetase LanKC [Mammaliicoccus sciuri]|uniref:class III lanthionine synthetase LanKC n=1 Tax=Mammaliicoccus sciuri TaxID=1296 RepID=UPI003F554E33